MITSDAIKTRRYTNPSDPRIVEFAKKMKNGTNSLEGLVANIFQWFDENVSYSRLDKPYFPLQRSDTDVLELKSGTCGDFSNLVVSVLTYLGYKTGYACVTIDCYGDEQDHICASVKQNKRILLIDPTQPYRHFHGFDCPHEEYILYSAANFEGLMHKQECEWFEKGLTWGDERYGGLLYAPWVLDVPMSCDKDTLESLFFLLMVDSPDEYNVYVNQLHYTAEHGTSPFMAIASSDGSTVYKFSINEAKSIWDDAQWSEPFVFEAIPDKYKTDAFTRFTDCLNANIDSVKALARLK